MPLQPLGELVEWFDNRRIPVKSADRKPGPYPYYGASGVVDWVDDYLFDGLHLLVSEDGENLRSRATPIAFLASGKYWVNNHAHVVTGNHAADTRFLGYAMSVTDISGHISGSAQPKLSRASLERVLVPAPVLDEQRAIAEVLGALDDKIAANDRLVAVAESLIIARASQEVGRCRISDVAEHLKKSLSPSLLGTSPVNHYSLPAFDARRLPSVEVADSILSSKFDLASPAVLLSKLNPRFPRVWDVPSPISPAVASTEFVVLQPREVSTSVLWAVLSQPGLGQTLLDKASGTSGSHQRVRPQEILDAEISDPRALPTEVAELITSLGSRVQLARRESQGLGALRDALLPELMSGRLRVKDAEKSVEGVV